MATMTLPPKNISENRCGQIPRTIQSAPNRVNHYLATALGIEYVSATVTHSAKVSSALIRCSRDDLPTISIVGRVSIDPLTGCPIPLTAEQIRDIHECADWYAARKQGELARDGSGHISRYQARRLANQWLDAHLSMKFYANGGLFFPIEKPIWQHEIAFKLKGLCLEPLGLIEVDGWTGDVKPLADERLQIIQERVHAVIEARKFEPKKYKPLIIERSQ